MAFKVTGDKELIAKLQTLRRAKLRAAVRKGSRRAAKIVQAEAKQLAPARTGALARAIRVRSIPRSRKWTGTQATFKVEGGVYYGGFVEAGHKLRGGKGKVEGQAFMRRAMKKTERQAGTAMLEGIREAIPK